MDDRAEKIAALLREAGEVHHAVWRITGGDDPDWPTWYADWLVSLSELPDVLGTTPVRAELTWLLVQLDKDYTASGSDQPWQDWYAERIAGHFGG